MYEKLNNWGDWRLLYDDEYKIMQKAELSDDERELILKYRSMSPEMKTAILEKICAEKQFEKQAEDQSNKFALR